MQITGMIPKTFFLLQPLTMEWISRYNCFKYFNYKNYICVQGRSNGGGLSHRREGGWPLLCENHVFKCIPPHTHQVVAGVSCRRAAFLHR